MNLKKWFENYGILFLIFGLTILAVSLLSTHIYETIGDVEISSSPNHPITLVGLFGMILIVIGASSLLIKFKNPEKR